MTDFQCAWGGSASASLMYPFSFLLKSTWGSLLESVDGPRMEITTTRRSMPSFLVVRGSPDGSRCFCLLGFFQQKSVQTLGLGRLTIRSLGETLRLEVVYLGGHQEAPMSFIFESRDCL